MEFFQHDLFQSDNDEIRYNIRNYFYNNYGTFYQIQSLFASCKLISDFCLNIDKKKFPETFTED